MSVSDLSQPAPTGQIITFYSFKGGTGRTMALANVAWILAANGKRVLVADWDLESPGLHRFFQPFLDDGAGEAPGVIDFIRRYEWAAAKAPIDRGALEGGNERSRLATLEAVESLVSQHIAVQDYTARLNWRFPGTGTLEYLSPGKQRNGDYQSTLGALAWDNFYDQLFGGPFFDALRASMKQRYDYVLIDSRTGLSDVADICTVHLPDTVIDCFTLSTQGIEGAAMIADMIKAHTERRIRILPVPMRIDDAEKEKAETGLAYAARKFAGLPAGMSEEQRRAYWPAVGVPYRPFYSYEEILAVFGDPPGNPASLLSSFERIAARVSEDDSTGLPPMEESLRLRTRLRFSRRGTTSADEVILDFNPEDQLWAEWISAVLAGADIAVRYVNEAPSPPPGPGPQPQTISVISESYVAQLQHTVRSTPDPDFIVSVTDARLPYHLEGIPVIFLAGLSEDRAAERLLNQLYGGGKSAPRTADVRYPGGTRRQILGVPARNANFTGRETELGTIRGELRSRGMAVVLPVTIQGLGGVGKTQVALEYAHRFKADYDVIWWMNCGQSQYIDASLLDLGQELRDVFAAHLPEEGSGPEVAQVVLGLLSDSSNQLRWLLVYDNADDIETVRSLLPRGQGHVLVTSRDEGWKSEGTSLEIDVFDRMESIRHLQRRVPEITTEDADRVAEVVQDLPLAVATAGAWLADTRLSVDDYLRELKRQAMRPATQSRLAYYPEPAAQTWDLSLGRLGEISPAGAWLLGLCSVMAPDIGLDLIYSQAMATVLERFDPAITEPVIIGRLVRQIDRLALIKLDSNEGKISVHRVVQTVVRERMLGHVAELQADVHQILVAARPIGEVDNPETWPRFRQIWPHLTPSEAMRSGREPVRQLLIDRTRYLWLRGDIERARRRATEIELAWEGMLAAETDRARTEALQKQLFRLKFNKANILRTLAEFRQAREIDEEVLAGQRRMLGAEHPHTLMTRSSLAADLRAIGEYQQALVLDRDTYTSWAKEYGEDYFGTLAAANNLATSLRLTGDFQSALAQDKLTYERRAATAGHLNPRTLHSGIAVARDLLAAGRYAETVSQMRTIWAQCHDALGDSDRRTLNARLLLGIALRCAGDAGKAEAPIEEARIGLTRGFGADASETLACRLSQALNLLATNRVEEGRRAAQQVLAVYEARLGPEHPHSLICTLNIATALCLEQAWPTALELAQSAVNGLEGRLGPTDPYTLSAKMVVGAALASLQRLAEADQVEEEVVTQRTRTLGPQHPDTLRGQANLLLTRHEQGVRGATADRQVVIRELKVLLGAEHEDVGTAIQNGRLLSTIDPQPF